MTTPFVATMQKFLDELRLEIERLQECEASLEKLLEREVVAPAVVPGSRKAERMAKVTKSDTGKDPSASELAVRKAMELARKVTSGIVPAAVLTALRDDGVKASIETVNAALWYETKKPSGRLRKLGRGYYDIQRNPVKQVPPMSKEEFEQKVAEAKAKP